MAKHPYPLFLLDRTKRGSLQLQLRLNLKRLVHNGVLEPGKEVPSSRELARELQISRNTVLQVYDRLVGEGYLEALPRRGLFVSQLLEERSLRRAGLGEANLPPSRPGNIFTRLGAPIPFRPCQPDVRLFPLHLWNRARGKVLRKHGADLLRYQSDEPLGLPQLRQSLAAYLQGSRGVRCDWRQVAITTGSQQALFLLAHLLLKPGDPVAMEDPGYLGARWAWQHIGATIHPIPVDSAGMRFESEKHFSPKLIYTTPSRQFPIGSCLSLPRRVALVAFAANKKSWIVEDDYDSEFRYSRAPLPSLQSLDSSQRVIYVGSTSKVLFPSLRIGYAVLPVSLVEDFARLRAVLDEHGPWIDQAALAEFIESGALYRHIRRCRRAYAQRLTAFQDSASQFDLPIRFPHTDGGMNQAGFLSCPGSDKEHSLRLSREGLEIPPLSRYSLRAISPGLLFGFTAFEPNTIRRSIKLVSRALNAR